MRSKKFSGIVVLLSALLIVPLVFSLNLVDTAELLLSSGVVTPSSSSPTVFVDPSDVIDETFQAGSKFVVNVNVSDVSDLFTWHVKVSWNKTVLNGSRIVYGDFLAHTTSPYRTSHTNPDVVAMGAENMTGIFNDDDYCWVAESVLGDDPGVGVSGNGCLASIEFLVVRYGSTDLNISLTSPLETTLLDSTGNTVTFTTVNGYFSNKILGDVDGDGDVDRYDFGTFAGAYGSKTGDSNYVIECDLDRDGYVDRYDFGVFAGNYGRHI